MDSNFDWDGPLSEHKAKVIESLLDRKTAPFDELIEILFGRDLSNPYNFLLSLISKVTYSDIQNLGILNSRHIISIAQDVYLYYYYYVPHFVKVYDCFIANEDDLTVHTNPIITALITQEFLPKKILRLPRYSEGHSNKPIILDYYDEYFNEVPNDLKEIIYHSINYNALSSLSSLPYTYDEAVEFLWREKIPKFALSKLIAEQSLSGYLIIADEYIINTSEYRNAKTSINFCRSYNCGNPNFPKRYATLEKLPASILVELFQKGSISIRTYINRSNPTKMSDIRRSLPLETTDLETKMYLRRSIKFDKDYNTLLIKEIVFLKDDIDRIVREFNQGNENYIQNGVDVQSPVTVTNVSNSNSNRSITEVTNPINNPADMRIEMGQDLELIIKKRLSMSKNKNIKTINPGYIGNHGKSKVLEFIIKIMCIMLEANWCLSEITWKSIIDFIDLHIFDDYNFKTLTDLQEANSDVLQVGNSRLNNKTGSDRIGEYKREIFGSIIKQQVACEL